MEWWLRDFDLLSVVLRAAELALEATTVGGVAFLLLAGRSLPPSLSRHLRRYVAWSAGGFALAMALGTTLSGAELLGSGLPLASVLTANFVGAGEAGVLAGLLLALCLALAPLRLLWIVGAAAVSGSSLALSHAASRLHGQGWLLLLTLGHHLGTALWIGAMPFLLLALRGLAEESNWQAAEAVALVFSRMALVAVPVLALAGVGLSWIYVGSWAGLYGSSYGVLIIAKTYLLLAAGLLGWANQRLLRRGATPQSALLRLRRFGEVEIGLGFTAVLAAASLTAQSPATDLPRTDLVTRTAIVERFHPAAPRLSSPPLHALSPPDSMAASVERGNFSGANASDSNDRAWSEYNHHWAGVVVALAALLALVHKAVRSPRVRAYTQCWPLLFLGLSAFVLLRADPENWPLGPRPFWQSLAGPDVLEHRFYALLIAVFAVFEWRAERRVGTPAKAWQAYVFPLLCALGGAALLTHTHATGDPHEEMLAQLSHTPLAVLGATAGWGRWLELRLPGSRAERWAALLWPVCLLLAGLLLLNYRES